MSNTDQCPVCHTSSFYKAGAPLSIEAILERWRNEAGVQIDDEVMTQYCGVQSALHQCKACGFGMFLPAIPGTAEFYAAITKHEYYNPIKWEFWHALLDIKEYESPHLLEIGCGEGDFLDLVRTELPGVVTHGHDLNADAVEVARRKGHKAYSGDLKGLIERESHQNAFDVICLFQILEHLANPIEFLKSLRRLLKNGGRLVIGVPDAEGPIRNFPNALTELPPHHISRWCGKSFRLGMPRIGYHVEKIEPEPLPDYLWNTYLPVMWDEDIWPACLSHRVQAHPAAECDKEACISCFIDFMQKQKVRWLFDVPGHSLYVVLRVAGDDIAEQGDTNRAINKSENEIRLQRVFTVLTDLEPAHMQPEEEAWLRQIKAAVLFIGSHGREKLLEHREMELRILESGLEGREAELAEKIRKYNSLFFVKAFRKLKTLLKTRI